MKHFTLRNGLLSLGLVLGASTMQAQNAYLANFSLPRYIKAGVNYPISVWCRNMSSTPYTSCSVSWRLDGGTTHAGPNQQIGGGGIVTNNYLPVTHPVQLNTTQGVHTLEVWITTTVDTDPTNNKLTVEFTALTNWADKVVLLEARTETWCPQCPPSNTLTNELMANPDFAVAKFHLSDALDACTECITYYNQHNINYTPAGIIEMGEYGSYPITSNYNLWEPDLTARAAGVSPVELTLSSTVNQVTRVLTVTINAEFTYVVTGPFKLNVYVSEDNVAGPQQNAPANYIHNRVMRAMLGGVDGTTGVIPATPVVGTNYSHVYTYTVPAGYDISELQLIGVVEHSPGGFSNRFSINSVTRSVSAVGIADLTLGDNSLSTYPSPFVSDLHVTVADVSGPAQVYLYTLDGRKALERNVVLNARGTTVMDLGGAGLAEGIYLLRISTPQGSAEQRVVKMN